MLANLSGFDGSPESMRSLQLEYGAEIGRAIVNFEGPIVFCVVSRYHGGAFVVFSKALNPEHDRARRRGVVRLGHRWRPGRRGRVLPRRRCPHRGRPAGHGRRARLGEATGAERALLATELADLRTAVRSEKLGEVASEFDAVHSIHRAVSVGSVDAVIDPHELRPRIIAAIEAGLARRS